MLVFDVLVAQGVDLEFLDMSMHHECFVHLLV